MVQDIDIWRSAKLLVDQHGDDATTHASMRADELLEAGDFDGQRGWLRILRTIEGQLRGRGDEPVH